MPKQLVKLDEAQRAALLPNGIEGFVPRCVVCGSTVPLKRARGRSKDTCKAECHAVLREYRKFVIYSSRCPTCYHPSTPQERAEFIAWRKARGDRRNGRGRPPRMNREEALALALHEALGTLREQRFEIFQSHCLLNEDGSPKPETLEGSAKEYVAQLESQIGRFEKLIDSDSLEQSTLPASGQTA